MALTLNLVVPALAGLVAGSGAFATFATGSTSPIPATIERPCAPQTWPFIDSKCFANADSKRVRVVMAPRADAIDAVANDRTVVSPSPVPQASGAAAPGLNLTSRDTVLRRPDVLAPPPKVTKPRARKSEQRRWVAQSYQVPTAQTRGSAAVIVVRPLRLQAFR
jgi:hypothetical protein